MTMRSWNRLAALLPLLCACASGDEARTPDAPASATPGATEPRASPSLPAAEPASSPATAGEPRWVAQDGWVAETPSSAMRKAQFRLPGESGAADASLVVYHFGAGGGGGVEANLARWAGQFEQPDGSDSAAAMKSAARVLKGVPVTEADLAGTYVAETSPGSGERVREEGWRMLAAILETPSGAHYVKLVGPAATVARWENGYRRFLDAALP